ncbi:MAG: MinD/ParA family protein [Fibrobacter sp.]|nr:MinD/ParA family protein [Fibrobacter sp.]
MNVNDQAQRLRELASSRLTVSASRQNYTSEENKRGLKCRSIAVTSGKGGVGKTNIALSLAVLLASMNKKVLLLDADLGLANVHILLGVAPQFNMAHFLDGTCSLEEIIYHTRDIDILPGASGLEKLANLDRGRLEYLSHQFLLLEQRYDFIIIDTGAGIGTTVTQFISKADLMILVMTPEPTSLADAYAMVKIAYEKGVSKIATLVNMASSEKDGSETFDRLNALVVKFLKKPLELYGTVTVNREVPLYVRKQKLIVLEKPNDQFSVKLQMIARKISGLPVVTRKGFFGKFWGNM